MQIQVKHTDNNVTRLVAEAVYGLWAVSFRRYLTLYN